MKRTIQNRFDLFLNELTWLNLYLHLLEKYWAFPWKQLLLELKFKTYFHTTYKATFEYTIVTIRRLYYDNRKDTITLKKFSSELLSPRPISLNELDIQLSKFEEKINLLRNKRLGHLHIDSLLDQAKYYGISNEEVKEIVRLLSMYFFTMGKEYDQREIHMQPIEFELKNVQKVVVLRTIGNFTI